MASGRHPRYRLWWLLPPLALLAVAALLVQTSGLVAFERYRGFFAPVWGPSLDTVYFIERNTAGFVIGPGWEFFTPPATSFVLNDTISLHRLDLASGRTTLLERWNETPVLRRATEQYRSRIFNVMSASIALEGEGVAYGIEMDIPRVPSAEINRLIGHWPRPDAARPEWTRAWAAIPGFSEDMLRDGVELITVPGEEGFGAAILAVGSGGDHRVLVHNERFQALFPDGVPQGLIRERSRRESIERSRAVRSTSANLVGRFIRQGLSEAAAQLAASERMEQLGYYPRRTRLLATRIDEAEPGEPVFAIVPEEFHVGLFPDIAQAIAVPGPPVEKHMGQYIEHDDFDTSRRLNAWLDHGRESFVVSRDGRLYRLALKH